MHSARRIGIGRIGHQTTTTTNTFQRDENKCYFVVTIAQEIGKPNGSDTDSQNKCYVNMSFQSNRQARWDWESEAEVSHISESFSLHQMKKK